MSKEREIILKHIESAKRFKKNSNITKKISLQKENKVKFHLIYEYALRLFFSKINYKINFSINYDWLYYLTEIFLKIEYCNIIKLTPKKISHYDISYNSAKTLFEKMCDFGYLIKIDKTNFLVTKKFYKDYYEIWNLSINNRSYVKVSDVLYNSQYNPRGLKDLFYKRRKTLLAYNSLLERHYFEYGDKHNTTVFKPIYNCVITNNKNELSSGRFYCPLVTSSQRDTRETIKINGAPSSEIDIVSCHANILTSLNGSKPKDFYRVETYDREKFKIAFLIATGSKSKKMAKKHLTDRGYDLEIIQILEDMFGTDLWDSKWAILQKYESDWLSDVIEECESKNIPILSVHDSIIADIENTSLVKEIMKTKWKNKFNSDIILRCKNE
jgi:hypothetical protein